MRETNIQDSHEYQAEAAKLNFQHTLNSLLQLKAHLADKASAAKDKGKEGYFTTLHEASVIDDWINTIATEMMADYTIINRTNQFLNVNNEALLRLMAGRTPNLKSLVS